MNVVGGDRLCVTTRSTNRQRPVFYRSGRGVCSGIALPRDPPGTGPVIDLLFFTASAGATRPYMAVIGLRPIVHNK